jgi:hypothetical protein
LAQNHKQEIAAELFGLGKGFKAPNDGATRMAIATGDAILRDLILKHREALQKLGPGMVVYNHKERFGTFSTIDEIATLARRARADHLDGFADALTKAIDLCRDNHGKPVLIVGVATPDSFSVSKLFLDRAQEMLANVIKSAAGGAAAGGAAAG